MGEGLAIFVMKRLPTLSAMATRSTPCSAESVRPVMKAGDYRT
jgi:hypothetical protein